MKREFVISIDTTSNEYILQLSMMSPTGIGCVLTELYRFTDATVALSKLQSLSVVGSADARADEIYRIAWEYVSRETNGTDCILFILSNFIAKEGQEFQGLVTTISLMETRGCFDRSKGEFEVGEILKNGLYSNFAVRSYCEIFALMQRFGLRKMRNAPESHSERVLRENFNSVIARFIDGVFDIVKYTPMEERK